MLKDSKEPWRFEEPRLKGLGLRVGKLNLGGLALFACFCGGWVRVGGVGTSLPQVNTEG